jgi:hypothetical protein
MFGSAFAAFASFAPLRETGTCGLAAVLMPLVKTPHAKALRQKGAK